jgi:ATP-dependent helicase/nuclease subunit B
LSKNGFKKILDKTPNEKSGFRSIIRAKLFNDNNHDPNNQFVSKLFKMTAKNRVKEVEFISQTIKLLLIEGKTRPENICVAFNLIGNYSSLVRDIFGKYGIPINLTDRIPIKTSQPVVAAINILELVENDFYFRDLVRVLTNGFLQLDDINVNNLIFVANELKITAGLQNWKTSIKDSLSILEFKEDLNDEERERIKRKLKKAETDITKLSKLLIPFRKKSTSKEFISNFKILLLKLQLPCKVIKDSNGKEEEFVKSLTVLLNTLNEVLTLINPDDDQETNSLEFYIEQLRTISNWARFNVKEKSDFGVLVTSINEIRGLSFDSLFLGGLCDGDLPTRYSPEIFFSGSYQKKEQIHQTEERFHFYQALCTWNKNLYLTIPQKDAETELVESTFVKDIEKLFQFTNLEMMPETNIFSKEQLQIAISKNINNEQLIKSADLSGIKIDDLIKRNDIRKKRKEIPYEEFVYSGFIGTDDEEIKNYLSIFIESEFSVSQLETFAKCPFKYFAERILKLIPLEEPAEEAQPIELGNVLHSILCDFYLKVIDEKIPIGKVGTKEFSRLKNLIFEIAEKKITNLNLNSPLAFFEKEKILGINSVKEHSILYNFLLTETNSESNIKPKYFEYSFGNFDKNSKENIPPFIIGELKLRGKIDRIDVDEENKLFNVIDYKLKGKKPTFPELNSGLSLQLPVYLMAGKHIITNLSEEDFSGNQMIIYSLDYKESNFGPLEIKLSKKRTIDIEEIKSLNKELFSNTKEKIIEYHNKLKKGHFHLSDLNEREEKVCKYCDFKSVCRVKEVFEF